MNKIFLLKSQLLEFTFIIPPFCLDKTHYLSFISTCLWHFSVARLIVMTTATNQNKIPTWKEVIGDGLLIEYELKFDVDFSQRKHICLVVFYYDGDISCWSINFFSGDYPNSIKIFFLFWRG